MKRLLRWGLVGTVVLTCALWAAAVEVSPYFACAAVPSIGLYQIEHLQTSINVDPDLTRGYQLLATFKFKEAIPLLERAAHANRPAVAGEAETYLGYAYFNLRQADEAVRHLQTAVKLQPDSEMPHFYLANEYYLDGKSLEARQELLTAVQLRPTFVSALRLLAEGYRDEGKIDEAIKYYERIVKLLPNSGYYRFQLYRAYNDAGRYADARADLEGLIAIEPHFSLNYYRLGDVDLKLNDVAGARQAFARLRDVGGSSFDALALLGEARIDMAEGRLDDAETKLERARARRPDQPEVVETMASLQHIQNEKRGAIWRRLWMAGGTLSSLVLLAWLVSFAQHRKLAVKLLSRYNEMTDQIYDQAELDEFLVGFFSEIVERPRALMLSFNRQNNVLVAGPCRGLDGERPRLTVVTGNGVTNWASSLQRGMVTLQEVERSPQFEEAFPSLAERLRALGLEALIPFREKSSFLGMLALGPSSSHKRVERDVLMPLVTVAAQSMETLYLYESSMLDEGTGLYNKRHFKQQLGVEMKRADRYQQPVTLLTLDIDDFKKINDTYGHAQGDIVLAELGKLLRSAIREGIDFAARTGGEEFHVVLPATSPERAELVAERIRTAVAEHVIEGLSKPLKITVSLGLATYPNHAKTEKELVARSDDACYHAKRSGKNRVCSVQKLPFKGAAKAPAEAVTQLESRFEGLNIRDERSGLRNFTYFSMRLKEEVKRVDRYQFPCSLLAIKVDGGGDDRIRRLGVLLTENLREGIDTPSRTEQDELVVIVPETPLDRAQRLAVRLQTIASSHELSLTIGLAAYPVCARTDARLLDAAVGALRAAEQAGAQSIEVAAETEAS